MKKCRCFVILADYEVKSNRNVGDNLKQTTKKNKLRSKSFWIKGIIIFLSVLILIFFVIPPIALTIFVHRHVDYGGFDLEKYPLRELYNAADYNLSETVHNFETTDGETIWCSEIGTDSPKGVIIYLTGIIQPSITYFYGHAALMQQNGYASFLLEVRSHGNSTGKKIGLGYTEIEDVRAVVEYIRSCEEYLNVPIILQGVSMGGAISINSFGQIPEIDACIAMSPYASFETQIDLLLKKFNIPKIIRNIEAPVIRQTLKWNYGSEAVNQLAPYQQIQNAAGRPILLIACSGDDSVPVENTYLLKQVHPEAKMWIRDSWEHFIIKDCDFVHVQEDTEYCSYILSWLSSCDM